MGVAQMMVYHGSEIEVSQPDVYHSRKSVDFGKGFYLTPMKEQAEKWAARFKRHKGSGIVSIYEFEIDAVMNKYHCIDFNAYTLEWLEFITSCRRNDNAISVDMVMGGVANDKVYNTIELYFEGLIEKEEAIKRLKFEKPNLQICIRSQEIIDKFLVFQGSELI